MKKLYSLLLAFIGMIGFTEAQTASQYYFKYQKDVLLENMDGALSLLEAGADEANSSEIGFFPFSFAGTTYSSFSVSEDGVVVLGNATYTPYPYDNYFKQSIGYPGTTINPVYPILLVWGGDLYTATDGAVRYKIVGAQPSRKLVIEYRVNSVEDNEDHYNKTFQVWLFEGSNRIHYVYGNCVADWYIGANIGIASSATSFLSVDGATNTVSSTTVYSNEGQYPNPATVPTPGTAYIFSPTEIFDGTPVPPSSPVTVAVSMLPNYPVEGQKLHTIYLGYGLQSVTLSANVQGGNPSPAGYAYAWTSNDGSFSSTAATPSVSPKVTTTYTVTVSDGNGNENTKSITVYVIDPRQGDKFKICRNGKITISVSIEAVHAQLREGGALGDCSVALRTANSTAAEVATVASVDDHAVLSIYPNPASGAFHVRLPRSLQQASITIFDFNGRVVAQRAVNEGEQNIRFDMTGNPAGVYLVKVVSNGRVQSSKILMK